MGTAADLLELSAGDDAEIPEQLGRIQKTLLWCSGALPAHHSTPGHAPALLSSLPLSLHIPIKPAGSYLKASPPFLPLGTLFPVAGWILNRQGSAQMGHPLRGLLGPACWRSSPSHTWSLSCPLAALIVISF